MKRAIYYRGRATALALLLVFAGTGQPANAEQGNGSGSPQTADYLAQNGIGEIIVTARRRAESDLKVPVAVSVFSKTDLERRGIGTFTDIAQATPGVVIAAAANFYGTAAIRGVGPSASNGLAEQSVLFTIDGVSQSNASAVRFAQYDVDRVEVLKGPQALYFGKNATAGIISITTADPTDHLYAMGRVGYEFSARALNVEGVLSGPLSDTLGVRLAFFGNPQQGFWKVPDNGGKIGLLGPIASPTYSRAQHNTVSGVRGTLKFDPNDALSIRTKLSYGGIRGDSSFNTSQLFYCPLGVPNPNNPSNTPGEQDCKLDHTSVAQSPGVSSAMAPQIPKLKNDGRQFLDADQYLGSVDLRYDLGGGLSINTLSSYLKFKASSSGNINSSATPTIDVIVLDDKWDTTQELRLSSDWKSAFNFMMGGYYQTGGFRENIYTTFFLTPVNTTGFNLKTSTVAVFGEGRVDITDQVHLNAGGRYTKEKRSYSARALLTGEPRLIDPDHFKSSSFSPEVSLRYEPAKDLNLFVSYRKGTKSGGINTDAIQVSQINQEYKDEQVQGFEGGLKSVLADGQLRLDLTGYRYKYSDLQVGFTSPVALSVTTVNAGGAVAKGLEFNTVYAPNTVSGLRLTAALAYSHMRFTKGSAAACWTGQGVNQGCNTGLVGAIFTNQSLGGKTPARSPDWSGDLGASYEQSISDQLRIVFSLNGDFRSKFNPSPDVPPFLEQKSAFYLDAQLSLAHSGDSWELALIGKNLTDTLRINNAIGVPLSPDPLGVTARTGTATGGTPADYFGYPNDPRTVQLRLTVRFSGR